MARVSQPQAAVRVDFSWYTIVATLLANTLGLALPLVILQVYDRIIPHQAVASLSLLCAGLVVAVALEFALRRARASILAWAGVRYEHRLRMAALEHAFVCDLAGFEETGPAVHLERLSGIEKLRELRTGDASLVFLDLPFFFVYLGVIVMMSPVLAATATVMIALAWIASDRSGHRLRELSQQRSALDGRRFSFIFEVLRSVEGVKSLALEAFMQRRYERLTAQSARLGHDLTKEALTTAGTSAIAQQLMVIVVASVGAVLVVAGEITSGALAAAILLAPRMLQPILGLQGHLNRRSRVRQWQQDLDALFELPAPAIARRAPGRFQHLALERGTVTGAAGRPIFEHVDLKVCVGEILAVTGASGNGKSSLMWALSGVTGLSAGRLLINGRDLATLDVPAYQAEVAMLAQSTDLFYGTILDNLTRFQPERYHDEAMELCNALGLDSFFSERPDGLNALVGGSSQNGLPLAVGQRIALVRALLGQPRLILLDEANSALDREADQRLLALLLARKKDAAIVMVTHRPSYLCHADRAIELPVHPRAGGAAEAALPRLLQTTMQGAS